jgi:hypothetical protein
MTLHLLRLAVGADSLDSMRAWRRDHVIEWQGKQVVPTYTKRAPTRASALLDGGCIYWVVKGFILCRQPFLGFDDIRDEQGALWRRMLMAPDLIETVPTPRRPFQGWRYLTAEAAPPDLDAVAPAQGSRTSLPAALRAELRALGLD